MRIETLINQKFVTTSFNGETFINKEFKLVEIYFVASAEQTVLAARNDEAIAAIDDQFIREFILRGGFISTNKEVGLERVENYFLLAVFNPDYPKVSGRGGILVRKDAEGITPVYLQTPNGDMLLDFKGVGTPVGQHDPVTGTGVLTLGALEEFHALQLAHQFNPKAKHPLYTLPISATYHLRTGTGQVVRAIAGIYRPSYQGEIFPKHTDEEIRSVQREIIREFITYLASPVPQLATNHWGDNAFFPDTNDITSLHLTDFMEIRTAHLLASPITALHFALQVLFRNCSYRLSGKEFIQIIRERLGEIGLELLNDFDTEMSDFDLEQMLYQDKDSKERRNFVLAFFRATLAKKLNEIHDEYGYSFNLRHLNFNFPADNTLARVDLEFDVIDALTDQDDLLSIKESYLQIELTADEKRCKKRIEVLMGLKNLSIFTHELQVEKLLTYLQATEEISLEQAVKILNIPKDSPTDVKYLSFRTNTVIQFARQLFC
jgi:hypothetical protein